MKGRLVKVVVVVVEVGVVEENRVSLYLLNGCHDNVLDGFLQGHDLLDLL